MPKISVIVPVYKVEKYLNRCVESILNQSFKDFELILVDDGSPDKCPLICDEYAKKDNRVKVIHKENGGLSEARNYGLDYVFHNNSEWISFIDSDDWVHRDYLKFLYEASVENNVDVSLCDFMITNENLTEDREYKSIKEEWTGENLYIKKHINFIIACGKLYKKELFENIRFPLKVVHEDEWTVYKVLFQCEKLIFVNNELYYYYQSSDSITHNVSVFSINDQLEGIKSQIDFIKKHKLKKVYKYAMNLYIYLIMKGLKTVILTDVSLLSKLKFDFGFFDYIYLLFMYEEEKKSLLKNFKNCILFFLLKLKFYKLYLKIIKKGK